MSPRTNLSPRKGVDESAKLTGTVRANRSMWPIANNRFV